MMSNILKITFDASTIKGSIIKNMNYIPSMSEPQLYNTFPNILFIPSIKLKKDLFDKDLGDDIKKIFLSSTQLDNFITRLQERKIYAPITIREAQDKGIIYNNIKFVLDLFFNKGDKFFIYQTQYVINNYNWNNKYKLLPVSDKKVPNVEIKVDFILQEGAGDLSFVDSTRLNCMQKKNSIIEDYYYLVGLDSPTSINYATPVIEPVIAKPIYNGGKHLSKKKKYKRNKSVKLQSQ